MGFVPNQVYFRPGVAGDKSQTPAEPGLSQGEEANCSHVSYSLFQEHHGGSSGIWGSENILKSFNSHEISIPSCSARLGLGSSWGQQWNGSLRRDFHLQRDIPTWRGTCWRDFGMSTELHPAVLTCTHPIMDLKAQNGFRRIPGRALTVPGWICCKIKPGSPKGSTKPQCPQQQKWQKFTILGKKTHATAGFLNHMDMMPWPFPPVFLWRGIPAFISKLY